MIPQLIIQLNKNYFLGIYYHGKNVWQPEVGDVRVHFSYAGKNGDLVSVVGKQSGREIRPFETESGEELLFMYPGVRKSEEVFQYEHAQNRLQTWLYRLLGWFLMFLGFNCLSSLLDIIGKWQSFSERRSERALYMRAHPKYAERELIFCQNRPAKSTFSIPIFSNFSYPSYFLSTTKNIT